MTPPADATQATPVSVAVEAGVATVLVDRPPVNAMGRAVLAGLEAAAQRIAADSEVRAVIVTGGGERAFMAGADISEFEALEAEEGAMEAHSRWARSVLDGWAVLPQPVIAAVQADAVGGGLEFALLADLIVADPRARFGLPEVRLGLIPGGGGTQRLPRRVGAGIAKEMLLLGSVIDADRALAIGLLNRVSAEGEVLAEARRLADRLAALPRIAVQAAKAATAEDLAGALDAERAQFLIAFASDDFREGFRAFLERREPRFTHR